ncbi:hypothetical protein IQ247_03265 [Plectonema cf. radiosum LEGE 06105]|uniref:Uncharacterized protein n=1 Tax=Plectonema cf. radiosum LEGE 06105 TaxID=945769 RepID=A0A8J7F5K9_9CYAN|nr:hypothetical protein [Plectonema radiosum]MBE9211744.1 hypothetical protein [Plectonema cf. radiosum LEGE 06105]
MQSTMKRTKNLAQSDLSDFVFEPGNLFQGGYRMECKMQEYHHRLICHGCRNTMSA